MEDFLLNRCRIGFICVLWTGIFAWSSSVKAGFIDLSHWDFSERPTISLDGEWEFAWQRLISGEQPFPSTEQLQRFGNPAFSKVPMSWTKLHLRNYHHLSSSGYATYRVRILLPQNPPALALKVPPIGSSFKIWVNQKPLGGRGQVGTHLSNSTPFYGTKRIPLPPHQTILDIRILVSTFDVHKAGIFRPITLGVSREIQKDLMMNHLSRFFVSGTMVLMAIYHLILFLYRRKDRIHINFIVFVVIGIIRVLIPGDHLIRNLLPWLSFEGCIRIEYMTLLLSVAVLGSFLRAFFPTYLPKVFLQFVYLVSVLWIFYAWIVPTQILTHSVSFAHLFNLLSGSFIVWRLFLAWKAREKGSDLLLLAILVLYVTLINDVMNSKQYIHTSYYSGYAFFFLVFSQWLILAQHYSQSYLLLQRQRSQFLLTMADAIESKDLYTGGHVYRVASFSRDLALAIGLGAEESDEIYLASMAHDVGKIGIKDSILNKPSKLNPEEMEEMKTHPQKGYDILAPIEDGQLAAEIALYHQERWNGAGYPMGLTGYQIPLSARITGVADYWDAISSDRPYRKAMPLEKCASILIGETGMGLDPDLVREFMVQGIWARYLSNPPSLIDRHRINVLIQSKWPFFSDPVQEHTAWSKT